VGVAIDQNARDFLNGRYSLVDDIVAWFKAVDLFRETQDERMILREPTADDLRQHKTWIAGLIAEGERMLTETLARQKLREGAQLKLAEIEATLELLYLWQREWHGPRLTQTRQREILKAVFHVEEPAA
jgi:hypothetical protein